MTSLLRFPIQRPIATAMLFLGLGVLGVVSFLNLPVELLPEVVYPEINVVLALRGATPEQMERDLVRPVEEEVGKLDGVVEINANARSDRGTVRVSYAPDVDMKFALLQMESRMTRIRPLLPERAQLAIRRIDASVFTSRIMSLQVLGEGDLDWLRSFTEDRIQPELEAIDGVASAAVMGGRSRAVAVVVNPDIAEAHGLQLSELSRALEAANTPRTYLGSVIDGRRKLPVSITTRFTDLFDISGTVLRPEGPLRVSDVADVRAGLQEQTDLSRVNKRPSVAVTIQKDDEANLIEVSRRVNDAVERLNRLWRDDGVEILVIGSQSDLIEAALDTLKQAAMVGLILGLAVLYLFLRNVRFVIVLGLAIPASLLIALNLMYLGGLSLNVLSLCGLALAIGMLTDNGIVVMESIFKHYEAGKPPAEAAEAGTAEVGRAVVAATATTVAVFVPVTFIQTDYVDVLTEFALAISFPLMASLAVALLLIPAMAVRTLSSSRPQPLATGRLMEAYTIVLKAGLRHRLRVVSAVGAVLAVTVIIAFFFLLEQQELKEESQFVIYVDLPEGASLESTDTVVKEVETFVDSLGGVDRVTATVQEGQGQVTVILLPANGRPAGITAASLREQLTPDLETVNGGIAGFDPPTSVGSGGGGRRLGTSRPRAGGFNLQQGATGEQAVIRGNDLAILRMLSDDLAFRLQELEEIDANSVRPDLERSAPAVEVIPDAEVLFDRRTETVALLTAVQQTDPQGIRLRLPFLEPGGLETPIELRTVDDPGAERPNLEDLRRTRVSTPGGESALQELARIRTNEGRSVILRTDQSRRAVVSYRFRSDVAESQPLLDSARRLARQVVQDLVLPEGYTIELQEAETDTIYYWMMGIAAILIYMILASLFESVSVPFVIFCTLPTAAIGSCWALLITRTGLTSQAGPMAILGLVVLLGIAVNNGIILIDAAGSLRATGMRRERALMTACRSRVRPILMTSATTLLGVLPLALEFGADYEIWPPFAIAVIGGLSVSMGATLVLIPVAYLGLDQVRDWLTDIGAVGVFAATAAAGLSVWRIHVWTESTFWALLSVGAIWPACLGVVWAGLTAHRARAARGREALSVRSIQIQTLTKIYGAPGRLRQEWARFGRRTERLVEEGKDPVDRSAIKEGLSWKLPLAALLAGFHFYLETALWLYVITLAAWALAAHLRDEVAALSTRSDGAASRAMAAAGRHGLALLAVATIHIRLHFLSLTLATAVLWIAAHAIKALADRVRVGRVDPEHVAGRFRRTRSLVYRAAAGVPLLGVRTPPFRALSGVDLEIGRGMFGLLGPNGAGKTTLMRIVCQVLDPSYGSVAVNGANVIGLKGVRRLIGYLPQHFGLYDHLSAQQYLDYRALLQGFWDTKERERRVRECLEQVNLQDCRHDRIGSFSGGMRQRVGIAQTLLHLPQIIVVDEPTAGLDPVERIRFRNLLARISRDRVVIFSTHIVEDISGNCNQLAVLDEGRLLFTGTPAAMYDLARGRVWEGLLQEGDPGPPEESIVTRVRTQGGTRVRFLSDERPSAGRFSAGSVEPTLEDAYLHLLRGAATWNA